MNKWLGVLLVLFIILLAVTYIFIPGKLSISKNTIINCTISGANRFLLIDSKWVKWWPGNNSTTSDYTGSKKRFLYNGYSFEVTKITPNQILLLVSNGTLTINTNLNILPVSRDSIVAQWQCAITTSVNPIKRISLYREARIIQKNMAAILSGLQSFLEKRSNIYGINIQEIISKDSTLIATKLTTSNYPGVSEIYGMINTLKKHIVVHNAIETNYPMLHVKKITSTQYETMVAIPINKKLEGGGAIFSSRFVPWKTLTADVKGGIWTIDQARYQMQLYIHDYNRTPYAIPFESLITDRSLEQDTLKWISKICQAVS